MSKNGPVAYVGNCFFAVKWQKMHHFGLIFSFFHVLCVIV